MAWWKKTGKKIENLVGSTIYDLTHLEINTIIKDDMSCSKLPDSPREILHLIATRYDSKLIELGLKYAEFFPQEDGSNPFRGMPEYEGSGEKSFFELRERGRESKIKLSSKKTEAVHSGVSDNEVEKDVKMLERIELVSDDILKLLRRPGVVPKDSIDFDNKDSISTFRGLNKDDMKKAELNLDLRQFILIKKALDIGTETIVLQTIIGVDGDVTTRISKAFANQPITFINEMHHDAINISVRFWENLVKIVVKLGEDLLNFWKS